MKHLAAVVVLLVLLTGCTENKIQDTAHGCTLAVTVSSWSGWEEDYEPEETRYTYEIDSPGSVLVLPETGVEIKIVTIDMNGITFETEMPMAPYGRTINLGSNQTVFTVYRGQTLSLVTPTTDYGDIFIIELLEMREIRE